MFLSGAPANQLRRADPEAVHVALDRRDRQADAAGEEAGAAQLLGGVLPAAPGGRLDGELVRAGEALLLGEDRQALGVERGGKGLGDRSEEHTSELQSLMRISYAVFCLKKKKKT